MHGFFENGLPWVEIDVLGSGEKPHKIPVIVDTGFNQFLSIPYATAFPIGLALTGIGSGNLADGSESNYLIGEGYVLFKDKRIKVSVDIEPNSRPLLGTALLKEMGCILAVDPIKETVELKEVRS